MNPLFTLAVLLMCQQDPPAGPPVVGSPAEGSAVRIQVSGNFDVYTVYREDRINEAGITLNTGVVPPDRASDQFWAGVLSLRLDVDAGDGVTGVFQLENRSFDEGENLPFGHAQEIADPVNIQQAYLNVDDFIGDGFRMRVGVQEFALRTRPHDEAFFMHLGRSESFNSGLSLPGLHIHNTTDRDAREAAGLRLSYDINDFLTADAHALILNEVGSATSDESVYTFLLNGAGERHAAWLMGNIVAGIGTGEQMYTYGFGLNSYFGPDRELEFFGEVYGQKGFLFDEEQKVRKNAYAANAGLRVVGLLLDDLSAEIAYSIRTGNSHPDDGTDEAFQSYENVNRFIILQSAEFGIDVDTNVRIFRWGLGYGPFDVGGRPLTLDLDVGSARADTPIRVPTGGRLANRRRWGVEIDLKGRLDYNAGLSFHIQGGYLPNSPMLVATNENRFKSAKMVVLGADLSF